MAPVEMKLPARPESVAVARHRMRELGQELGLEQPRIDELRTLVSEACMNAAVHAYDRPGGEFEVSAYVHEDELEVVVSDHGTGIRPRPASASPTARLGLLLMAALARSVEISSHDAGGTTIRLRVPTGN